MQIKYTQKNATSFLVLSEILFDAYDNMPVDINALFYKHARQTQIQLMILSMQIMIVLLLITFTLVTPRHTIPAFITAWVLFIATFVVEAVRLIAIKNAKL